MIEVELLTTHPNSSIQRLFTERKEGGRGLERVKTSILIEALITAAQEQAEAGVYHTRKDSRWRLCKDAPATAGSGMQAGRAYMERLNKPVLAFS